MKKGIPRNKLDGRLPITNSMFFEENIKPQNILEKLYEKKLIQLKVPVKIITSKQAEFTNDYFLVSLKMREINHTYPPFGLMLRNLYRYFSFVNHGFIINDAILFLLYTNGWY